MKLPSNTVEIVVISLVVGVLVNLVTFQLTKPRA